MIVHVDGVDSRDKAEKLLLMVTRVLFVLFLRKACLVRVLELLLI